MDPAIDVEEYRRLRRTMRDLVALSTLPAVWVGLDLSGIARSLADVLLNTLSLELVYVRLADPAGSASLEVVRSRQSPVPSAEQVRTALAPLLLADHVERPAPIPHPSGDGVLHVVLTRFGIGGDQGLLVTGARRPDYPNEQDRLLLGVGANQTAIVVQRRRSEEQLLQQEKRTLAILESIHDGFCALDRNWRFIYVNRQAEVLLRRSREELLGRNHWELYADTVGTEVEHQYRRALAENVTVTFETFYPPHDCWYEIRVYPSPDGLSIYFRDVSERKRAEEQSRFLLRVSAELASIVDFEQTLQTVASLAVPYFSDWSAVDLVDGEGKLRPLAVAHAVPEKAALLREVRRECPPDPRTAPGASAVLRTGKPELITVFTEQMLSDNTLDEHHLRLIRWLGLKSCLYVPLVVSGNTFAVLTFAMAESGRRYSEADLALAMDLAHRAAVTVENNQLYQLLRDNDRRKDEFLATLAHELRNPLAPVRNALQILKMPQVAPELTERSREIMERQVQHLVRLVDDLLDVSRVMRGKIELRRERVELGTIIARAVETVQPLVDAQQHELRVSVSTQPLLIDADPVRLAQVVGNLLTNAAKYTEPGGCIWLTAEPDGDMALLRVRDTGIGIAPQMLHRIFDLFVQADHACAKAQGGLGIGLTLVKNLVEMHNGIVQVRSDGLGHGAEFIVKLPLVTRPGEPDPARDPSRERDAPPSRKRLLVVDDNRDAANSLAMLLRLQGHEVRVAYSGIAALEMIKTFSPQMMFLDIGMPGMDGYEVARRIRQMPDRENLVLAALTGWGQQADRRRTTEAGFNHHLVKPPEPEVLFKVLAES